jgi:Phage integrase, N-terminal SAM-like domain
MATVPAPYEFRPGVDSPYRRLPVVGPLLDDWLVWLRSRGYSELSIRNHVIRTARLCRWLQRRIGRAFSALSQSDLRAASDHFRGRRGEVAGVAHVLGRLLAERQRLRPEPAKPPSRAERELQSLATYLREVRGLSPSTVRGHCRRVRPFLHFLRLDERPAALGRISLVQIDAYLGRAAQTNNRFSMQQVVASLRTFLRHGERTSTSLL